MKVKPPAADMPSAADRKRLAQCNSDDLYYGMNGAALIDVHEARLCAFVEFAKDDDDARMPFSGAGILMMIYANGIGVKRNPALAKRFACELHWKAEASDRLLDGIDDVEHTGKLSEACDASPGWPLLDFCIAHDQRLAMARLKDEDAAVLTRWSAERRAAFEPVRRAADEYMKKRTPAEIFRIDRSLTQAGKELLLYGEFVAMLKAVDGGMTQANDDPAALDRDLNATYGLVRADFERLQAGQNDVYAALTPTALRDAERAWLAYAGAWETFRAANFAEIPPERLRAELTAQRLAALRAVHKTFAEE